MPKFLYLYYLLAIPRYKLCRKNYCQFLLSTFYNVSWQLGYWVCGQQISLLCSFSFVMEHNKWGTTDLRVLFSPQGSHLLKKRTYISSWLNNEENNQQHNIPFGSINKHTADTSPSLMCMGVGLPLACHIWLFLGANSKNIVEYYLNMRKTVSFRSPKTGAGKKVTFVVLLHRRGGVAPI